MAIADEVFHLFGLISVNKSEVRADLREVEGQADKSAKEIEKSFSRLDSLFGNIGKKLFAVFSVAAVAGIGKSLVEAASEQEETVAKLHDVFKDMSDEALNFASETAKAFDRSNVQIQKYVTDLQAVLAPTLENREQAAEMSMALTKLTFDLAAFHNMAEDDVINRLRSGLLGSTEAVDLLGVNIRQTALEQEMLNLGWEKSYAELTEQEKIFLRFNVIMKQTSDAHGNLIRTSEGFSNQQRRLQAYIKDLSATFGQLLLPSVNGALIKFNDFLGFLISNASKIMAVLEFIVDVFRIVFGAIAQIIGIYLTTIQRVIIAPFLDWLVNVWKQNQESLLTIAALIWENLKQIFDVFVALFKGDWKGAWNELIEAAVTIWNSLPIIFENAMNIILNVLRSIADASTGLVRNLFGEDAASVVRQAWDVIILAIEAGRDLLLGIWEAINLALQGDWVGSWNKIKEVAGNAWENIKSIVENSLDIVRTVINSGLDFIENIIRGLFGDKIGDIVGQGFDVVRNLVNGAIDTILGILDVFTLAFEGNWSGAWDRAKEVLRTAWDTIKNAISGSLDVIEIIIDGALSGIVELIRMAFGDDAANVVNNAFDSIRNIIDSAFNAIKSVLDAISAVLSGDWAGAWESAKEAVRSAWDAISGIITITLDTISTLVDTGFKSIASLIGRYLGDDAANAVDNAFNIIRNIVSVAVDFIKGLMESISLFLSGDWSAAWSNLVSTIKNAWDGITNIVNDALTIVVNILESARASLTRIVTNLFGEDAGAIVDNIFKTIISLVQGFKETIVSLMQTISAILRGDWSAAWEGIKETVVNAFNAIRETVANALDLIGSILDIGLNAISGLVSSGLDAIQGFFTSVFGEKIGAIVGNAFDNIKIIIDLGIATIKGIIDLFTSILRGDWQGAWDALSGIAEAALNAVKGIAGNILDSIKLIFSDSINALRQKWNETWDGVSNTFESVWDGIKTRFDNVSRNIRESVVDLVVRISDVFRYGKDTVIQIVSDLVTSVTEWFSEKLSFVTNPVQKVADGVVGVFSWLADVLVGHSIVPDMVEDIGESMEGLNDAMVTPTEESTKTVKDVVNQAADDIKAAWALLMEKLKDDTEVSNEQIEKLYDELKSNLVNTTEEIGEELEKTWKSVLDGIGKTITDWIVNTTVDLFNGVKNWTNMFQDFGNVTSSILKSILAAIVGQMVQNIIAQNTWLTTTLANIATAVTAFLGQAYAALVGFFWFLGPAAPIAAAGVIAAAIAGIASIAGQVVRGLNPTPTGVADTPNSPDPLGSGSSRTGKQISEITGPTRDLLTSLLSPLARLDEQTGILNRIYNVLDARLPMAGSVAGGFQFVFEPGSIQINAGPGTNGYMLAREMIDEIERILAENLGFALGGRG